MDPLELFGRYGLFVLLGLLFVGQRYRYGLTYAVLWFIVGAGILGLTIWSFVAGIVSGFGPRPWATGFMLVLLWGLFYGLDLYIVRPYSPAPANEEGLRTNPDVIRQWDEAGITEYGVWRMRPRAKGLVYAYRPPTRQAIVYSYYERGRWQGFIVSGFAAGSGHLVTSWDSIGLFDRREIRQIIHAREWDEAFRIHRDAIEFLEEDRIVVDAWTRGSLVEPLLDMNRRDRRAMLQFPVGFLGSLFRPIFHVGPLRRRMGRHWQLRQFD